MHPNNPMHYQNPGAIQPMQGDVKGLCRRYMNYHIIAQMNDGSQFDGIIDGMDDDGVTMLIPEDIDPAQLGEDYRQFGFGYDFDDYDDYGRPRRRFRRFRRRRFPFNVFSRLFLYPYYTPFYPFFPGYY